MMGVYKILNTVNNKFYIGSSVNIQQRFKAHISYLNKGVHNNQYLQNAWNKYGESSFEFIILEEVFDTNVLRDRERYYIQTTDCTNHDIGYNLLNDTNIGLGVKASAEIRKKISDACKGEKNGNYGRKHTEEELIRMYENRWGKNYVKKPRKKAPRKTEEELKVLRQRISERMKGRIVSDETRQKISKARLGTHVSEQTREKFRKQRKGANNANSKLTKEQVLEIYEKMNSGVNYKEVCAEYGIGQCWAYKIKRKEHWVFDDEK